MSDMTTMTNHPRAGVRGFTLLEVMLSVVIIGLGVLGLSAIFAGAASQQVASARTTEASAMITRIEQIVRDRMGMPMVGYGVNVPADVGATSVRLLPGGNGQYEPGLDFPMAPTVWYPLSSYEERQATGYPSYATTLDPSIDPTMDPLNVFFLNEAPAIEIYHNPLDVTAAMPLPIYHSVGPTQLPGAGMHQTVQYAPGGTELNEDPFYGPDGRRTLSLPHARIQPGTFRVRFEIAKKDSLATSAKIVGRRTVKFDDTAFGQDADGVDIPDSPDAPPIPATEGLTQLHPFGASAALTIPQDRVLFDRALFPNTALGPRAADILEFDIALGPFEWIERIVVEPYQWRSDILLTLSERMGSSIDGSSMGVVAFMQGSFAGSGRRLGLLAYTAEPTERGAVWIPPESGQVNLRLLRRVQVFLGYDTNQRAHYIRPVNMALESWITEQGQILLFAGDPDGNPVGLISDAGSDAFARVTRQIRLTSNEIRGMLDFGPRSSGLPFYPPENGDAQLGTPLYVWVLHPVAQSLAPNNPSFRIKPVDAAIIQIR